MLRKVLPWIGDQQGCDSLSETSSRCFNCHYVSVQVIQAQLFYPPPRQVYW